MLAKVEAYQPNADLDLIRKAYIFAATSHDGQKRRSGEPYITHPLAVSNIIADMRLDVPSICAALLHDTVEDTAATYQDVETLFSKEIADLVDGVTKLGKLRFRNKQERQAESFRKMLVAMSKDIRVILVKLADRLHNMRTLGHVPSGKASGIAYETRDIYAPLANRLGMQWVKIELEDLSFRYTDPASYQYIRSKVNEKRSEREQYINQVVNVLDQLMDEHGISVQVTGRPKHFASIHRKMESQNIDYDQVYDAIAFRILVDDVKGCYEALGVIHTEWRPIPGRFKDYIALPKPNRYQSLHTAVMGPKGRRMEVQIRSQEMHRIAENGIAAHWKYKEGQPMRPDDEHKFAWLRQLLEYQQELDDPTDFFDMVKLDLFAAEVYVFTPQGDLKVLPRGSTPVDFAYAVHTEVGSRCSGALVNNVMVKLDCELKSGDTCQILTRTDQQPSADWLKFVRTGKAKSKIRQLIRTEQRQRARQQGRDILEKLFRKYKRSFRNMLKNGDFTPAVLEELRVNSVDDLTVHVGYGKVRPEAVIEVLVPEAERKRFANRRESRIEKVIRDAIQGKASIRVDGLEDVVTRFARCCVVVPGDSMVGFITRGRGVTVHRLDCKVIADADPDRRIDVRWEAGSKASRPVSLVVTSENAPGLLAEMSSVIGEVGVNIVSANCRTERNRAINLFEVLVANADELHRLIRALEGIDGVSSVRRS